jgi:hypothetical protein
MASIYHTCSAGLNATTDYAAILECVSDTNEQVSESSPEEEKLLIGGSFVFVFQATTRWPLLIIVHGAAFSSSPI